MPTATLVRMAKHQRKQSEKKRIGISIRIEAELLERIDEFCASQPIPVDRTAFFETGARRLLEAMSHDSDADDAD